MEMRNMPAPGEDDMGGNPLQEGIYADGGWANRMKRDESFASVRTAFDDDDWGDDDDMEYGGYSAEANPHGVQERFIVDPNGQVIRPSQELLAAKGDPEKVFHEDIANENGMGTSFLQGHSLGVAHNDGNISFVQHDTPFDAQQMQQVVAPHYPEHSVDPELATSTNEGRWEQAYDPTKDDKGRPRRELDISQGPVMQPYNPPGAIPSKPRPWYERNEGLVRGGGVEERTQMYLPWSRETHDIEQDFDVTQVVPPGPHTVEVDSGEDNPVILQHDNPQVLDAAKERLELSSSRVTLRDVTPSDQTDFLRFTTSNIDFHHPFAQPPANPAYFDRYINERRLLAVTDKQNGQIIGCYTLHQDGSDAEIGVAVDKKFARRGYMNEGADLLKQAAKELGIKRWIAKADPSNAASIAFLKRRGYSHHGGKLWTKIVETTKESGYRDPTRLSAWVKTAEIAPLLAPLAEGIGGAEVGGMLGRGMGQGLVSHLVSGALGGGQGGGGGGGSVPTPQVPEDQSLLSSVHAELLAGASDHPDSYPGPQNTDDPEDVDPLEFNDGEHGPLQSDQGVNDQGGTDEIPLDDSEVGMALKDALPALLHYFTSDEPGGEDPSIQRLLEVLSRDYPNILDAQPGHEDIAKANELSQHYLDSAKLSNVPGDPAQLAPGTQQLQSPVAQPAQQPNPMSQASCTFCGARLTPGSGLCPQCGSSAMAPSTMNAQPQGQQIQPIHAGNQGPHNSDQIKMVAEYLQQTGREDEIQNLALHPEQYGDELAEIQMKDQPPDPDPDPGPPPPMPPQGMPIDQAQAPMPMPMTGKVAADSVAPNCPNCGSHTTQIMISDIEPGNMSCSRCGHMWKRDDVVPSKLGADPNPNVIGVPAADQEGQYDAERDSDSSRSWLDQDGAPLQVGAEYEMYSNQYDIPDIVRIEAVRPNSIDYTLTGAYNLEHRTTLTLQEAQIDGVTFSRSQDDTPDAPHDETATDGQVDQTSLYQSKQGQAPAMNYIEPPDIPQSLQVNDYRRMRNQGEAQKDTLASKCEYCGQRGHDSSQCPAQGQLQVTAGKKYSPSEQKEFIHEEGLARNADKLDLTNTHYESTTVADSFLFGL
jgi:RimJ/RimL family protein N-acetyltransferase